MIKFKCNSCDGIYKDSLDVRFGKQCDNNCAFCIEKNGDVARPFNVDEMIKSTIASKKTEILILGGEPFLRMNDLYKYVIAIREHVSKIYITTALPKMINENWKLFKKIFTVIDGLNVSIQSENSEKNSDVLNSSPENRFDRFALLKTIFDEVPDASKKIRVSINLVKGYIDSNWAIIKALSEFYDMGCRWVKINELQHSSESYVSFEDTFKSNMKLKSPYAHGCQIDIQNKDAFFKYRLTGMRVTLKRACFAVEQSRTASFSDCVKAFFKKLRKKTVSQIVLYEDGELSKGWISRKNDN